MSIKVHNEKGQTLAIIIIIVLVVLTIGLAVVARSLTGLRQTTKQEESLRAHDAAEAGAEEALRRLKNGEAPSGGTPITGTGNLSSQSSQFNYTISAMQGLNGNEFGTQVVKDQAYQVSLAGLAQNTTIDIYWWKTTAVDGTTPDNAAAPCDDSAGSVAAIEFIYLRKVGSTYTIERKDVFDPCAARQNNYSTPATGPFTDEQGNIYQYKITPPITLQQDDDRILRIVTQYNSAWVLIKAPSGVTLPAQGSVIESKGSSGQTERTIKVSKSVASLPSIFDFSIFSGSQDPLQK